MKDKVKPKNQAWNSGRIHEVEKMEHKIPADPDPTDLLVDFSIENEPKIDFVEGQNSEPWG